MTILRLLLIGLVSCVPATLQAHHSVALNFSREEIVLEGTITDLRWVNPHCTFVLQVENEAGDTEEWLVELLALIALERQGFELEWLREGMEIQLTGRVGYRERNLRFVEAVREDGMVVRERDPAREIFRTRQ